MFLLAISLAFMAVGIILIYLLWGINKIEGQTLNATAFYMITNKKYKYLIDITTQSIRKMKKGDWKQSPL